MRHSGLILALCLTGLTILVLGAPRLSRPSAVIPSVPSPVHETDQPRTGAPQSVTPTSTATGQFEASASAAVGGAPHPSGGIGEPASYCKPSYCDEPLGYGTPGSGHIKGPVVTGAATWYSYVYGGAAAAQRLRDFLGPDWRGTTVQVCYRGNCVRAILLDYESSTIPGRLIDLDSRLFAALAPLSSGIIDVTVREVP